MYLLGRPLSMQLYTWYIAPASVLFTPVYLSCISATIIQTYKPSPIYTESEYFSLQVNEQTVPVHAFDGYAYAHFSFGDGPVNVNVTSKTASITSFAISPTSLGLNGSATVSEDTLSFTMIKPDYVIVHLSGIEELIVAADPLETNTPPSSGPGIFNVVTQFGADPSGNLSSTVAFQNALQAAGSTDTGSIVFVPPGVFPVGNLVLSSGVSLYLSPGSSLRFTGNSSDYTTHWKKTSQNLNGTEWISTAYGSHDIRIYGRGTIDANGAYAQKTGKFIAHAVVPLNTTNFTFDGPIIRDGGSWTLVPTRSSYVTINHAKIFNRMNLGENDAIDIQESQHVIVKNTIGIALDDSFSTKTWEASTDIAVSYPGLPQPLYNVTFINCLAWTHCYGFKIGQGTFQEQRKIRFEGSTVYDAAVGLGVHHKWGYAAAREIEFTDMAGTQGIVGPITDVSIWNINVRNRGETAALTQGVEGALVSNVKLGDVWFEDLGRTATTLEEMSITETGFSSNVTVKS